MVSSDVRVRFAPSPTGYLHVGGARTVLYNWLFARHLGGKFILRIEDTDQERSTREAERMQLEDIRWMGFDYDEGPEVGGAYAPYRQSERLDLYAKYAQDLLAGDRAYYCFCSDEVLDTKREAAMKAGETPQYDGTCLKISKADALKRKQAGEKPTVRFKAPVREYRLHDLVRGEVVFPSNMVGDFVILRNDGMPVYNFCVVIDDHLMKITHVLRAEEHLSNTVRQMMLYEAYGWPLPQFGHMSLILGADRSKLSKRHGATSVHQYNEEGYLREALLNFLVLLGWSSPTENKEIMTIDEMVRDFSLDRLNKAPSVFDPVKLKWMNGQYIKAYPLAELTRLTMPFLKKSELPIAGHDEAWIARALDVIRGNLETLADAPRFLRIFFDETFDIEPDAVAVKSEPTFTAVAGALKAALEKHLTGAGDNLTSDDFAKIQDQVKVASGAKGKGLFMPMRVVLTGHAHGPDLKLIVPLLGTKRSLARIEKVLTGK
ncbi:MAG: glutamate--tRNA ligase [Deltaproteobacteria bacterium]|nr:glutamate--tRNA ligase [Deltaproteobacteria bacterium]